MNIEFIKEQKNPFDFEYDFVPTNDDMVNNKENILNCIHSTNDINLILTHRSLYILQKKFEQNKEKLKSIYEKYGEYLDKEEEKLLIEQNYLPKIINEIFNINKFEISDVVSFKEALFKEMEYCKEINIEQYIFNEFIEFIKTNRKKYNFIYREKRNNKNFNLDNYNNIYMNIIDDWTTEDKISLYEDEHEKNEMDIILKDINERKIKSAKYNNKMEVINIDSEYKLKLNLDLINKENEENKNNENSYSESSILFSGRKELSSRAKDPEINYTNEKNKGTHRSNISNINTKRNDEGNNKNDIIQENEDDDEEKEKETHNNPKEIEEDKKLKKSEENKEEEEENEDNEDNEEEESDGNDNSKENNNLDDIDLVNIDKKADNKKKEKNKNLLFSNPNKNEDANLDIKLYKTNYEKGKNKIKTIKYNKYYLYLDILPLILADFISDPQNLYIVIDHSDDLRNNLSSIFDSEILYKLGETNFEEVINQMLIKISEYKKSKVKVVKNIDNYEKLSEKMKNKKQDITYINITLQKLKDFLNWLNNKIHYMQKDIQIFKEFEKNKKEEHERIFGNKNNNKFAKNKLKEKKDKIIEEYNQLKKDLEVRKFLLQKKKRINKINNNKVKLKPIINSTILNNSNSNNNISNIEKDNSNSHNLSINSNEMPGDEYKKTFLFSKQNLSNKKIPEVKNFNFKTNFEGILTEKKVDGDEEENQENDIEENINDNNSNNNKDLNDNNNFSSNNINNNELIESNQNEINNNTHKEIESNEKNDDINNFNSFNNFENKSNESREKMNEIKEIESKEEEEEKEEKEEKENEEKIKVETKKDAKTYQSQPIKKSKKPKLILKSNINNKKKILNNNINISNNLQLNTVNINSKEIKKTNYNINSTDKLKSNPKTTRNTKKKINFILKNISKKEKPQTKEEIREEAIFDIFNFYSTRISNNSTSLESLKNNKGFLNLTAFCKFCNDFKIPLTKDKILSLFNKSISGNSRNMSLKEFKICLISLSFEINKSQIDDLNRSINIFITKVNQKNKEKSRFAKDDPKEKEKNKEIISKKLKLIEKYQNKSEEELIEEFFIFLDIDDTNKYKQKMKGIFGVENKTLNLPKIKTQEIQIINNTKDEHSKSNALLTLSKKENGIDAIKKMNIGRRVWVKGMIEKERSETPKKAKVEYVSEESEENEEKIEKKKDEEKKEDLPVIESQGMPLFTRNKKKDEKKYLYEKFL